MAKDKKITSKKPKVINKNMGLLSHTHYLCIIHPTMSLSFPAHKGTSQTHFRAEMRIQTTMYKKYLVNGKAPCKR